MGQVYGDAGEVERALTLFEQYDASGMVMDVFCFNTLMGPVLKKDDPETVLEVMPAFGTHAFARSK